MSSFPFLRLPQLVQVHVLRKCKNEDLFFLSFCSERTKQIVRLANVLFVSPTRDMHLNYYGQNFGLMLYENNKMFTIEVNNLARPCVVRNRRSTGFDGISVVRMANKCFVHPGNCVQDTAQRIVDLVMFLIGHKNPKVRISTDLMRLKSVPYWKWSKHMWSLNLSDCRAELTGEHVDFMMDELTIGQKCSINILHTGIGASPYTKGFKADHLSINDGTWIHHNAILNSESSGIWIYKATPPTMAQVNQFLKSWLAKTHLQNMKNLVLKCEHPLDWDEEVVFDGISAEVGDNSNWSVTRDDGSMAHINVNLRTFFLFIRFRDC